MPMIPWWWAVIALVCGVFLGFVIVALISANDDE